MAAKEKDRAAIELARGLEHVPWCDDYEKMISGVLYDPQAPELVQGRFRARRLMHSYNTTFPADATAESLERDRRGALGELLGRVGAGVYIEPPLMVDYGCNITIGDDFIANYNLIILDCAIVDIGHRVMLGPSVSIFAATHETDVRSRRRGVEFARPVRIGDDCWIGGNTTIMPGVTIGRGSTVGAGSVVTRSVPAFSVAIGAPARVVKTVEAVEEIRG